jgi:hypothetical protein
MTLIGGRSRSAAVLRLCMNILGRLDSDEDTVWLALSLFPRRLFPLVPGLQILVLAPHLEAEPSNVVHIPMSRRTRRQDLTSSRSPRHHQKTMRCCLLVLVD